MAVIVDPNASTPWSNNVPKTLQLFVLFAYFPSILSKTIYK